ncbi:hypothetical protein [Amycolatopsis sp. La24]|uniref:hypothetical protein n=1 Tax=Amycolatopsis sp. La24 TaxID=3028304 RepID=UPI0023B0DA61|nr:hypothetical protein [Amycolatopsis sp. La24]
MQNKLDLASRAGILLVTDLGVRAVEQAALLGCAPLQRQPGQSAKTRAEGFFAAAKNRCGRNPAAKYVILVLAGTLLPGHTSRHYLRVLLDDGTCDRQAGLSCLEAIAQCAAAENAPPGLLDEICRSYALAMKGESVAPAGFAAEQTWRASRGTLFSVVPEVLSLLRAIGCRIHLLSGNHDFPVQEAAIDLGLPGARCRRGGSRRPVHRTPAVRSWCGWRKTRLRALPRRSGRIRRGASAARCCAA